VGDAVAVGGVAGELPAGAEPRVGKARKTRLRGAVVDDLRHGEADTLRIADPGLRPGPLRLGRSSSAKT
jgi:hypothetical protein